MLGSVKSQMTSWLGSGVLGLKKSDEPGAETQDLAAKPETESPASEKSVKGSPVDQKDDDDSSATGGADSDVAASEPGTPAEEKDGGQPFGAGQYRSSILLSCVNTIVYLKHLLMLLFATKIKQ